MFVCPTEVESRITLKCGAIATSGDYLNSTEFDGVEHSHIIDPVAGVPVQHRLHSVTVVGKACAMADAIATACLVIGTKKSMALVEATEGYEAYFIESNEQGERKTSQTSGFSIYEMK